MMKASFSARGGWWVCAVASMLIALAFVGFTRPAWAAFAPYSLGDLSLQNGWDSGIAGNAFTNNNAGTDVVENTVGVALTGTQYWRYGGSYGSPGSGTPSTPYVATVGAPNAASAFGGGLNSPVTPAGDQSVISFAFKAIAPGDGSQINVHLGNRDAPANGNRTGPSIYITATSATDVTLHRFHLSSTDLCSNQDFPDLTLATVAAGTWHTVKMTTTYPNVTPSNFATYGTTVYVIDEGTGGQITVTDPDSAWVHQFNFCHGIAYSPGTSVKWSSSFNDTNPSPAHQGFYVDDVSMKVINTGTATTVASFATSFEAALLNQAALSVNVTSPAAFGSTQTLTTSGGSGDGAVSYSVGGSTACSVIGDQLTITSASGTCAVTATKAADDVYNPITSSAATVIVQQVTPTISINNIPGSATFGGSFTPTYAYTGDGVTSVTSSTTGTCTVSGGVVNFVGGGTCTLTAHATATVNYTAATGSAQSFTIATATPTISINNIPGSATVGGSFTPTYVYTGDGVTSVTSSTTGTCTVSGGVVNFVGGGTCTLTAHATATANYAAATGSAQSFTIAPATPTISIPTLSEWALASLALLMLGFGMQRARRRR